MPTLEERKYKGPVDVGMVFTCPDNNGVLGYRRLKVIADLGGGMLVLEEMPSRMLRGRMHGEVFKCPELNLRIVFQPEEETDG